MREIRTLRAMWRSLEAESWQLLTGHEEGNLGRKPRRNLRVAAPALDPTAFDAVASQTRAVKSLAEYSDYSLFSSLEGV